MKKERVNEKMDYQKVAMDIVRHIGGVENIASLEHCSTRLRFHFVDKKRVQQESLKKITGVMGVIDASQFQIVIGNDVVEVYDEIMKVYTADENNTSKASSEKRALGKQFIEFIISVFQPLVPVIAGAGVLKSVLMLLAMTPLLDKTSTIYNLLVAISDATFYFLPIMVAITTANVLKCNRLVAVASVGYLLLPATTTLLSGNTQLLGFTIPNITYHSQVFPAILCVIFLSFIEKLFNKISPKVIRIFFVPMMVLAITVPVTLLILGPLGYNIGTVFTTCILYMYDTFGFVAVGILAGILPFMIATGMHKALLPYATSIYAKLGYEALYIPASLAHNISQSGACFAVALRSKDETLKQTALSAGVSALMGITEPALYGVTLQHKKALMGVIISSVLSGLVLGVLVVKAFVLVGPGLVSMSAFVDQSNDKNILLAMIGFVIALFGSFIITCLLWKDEKVEETKQDEQGEMEVLLAPVQGKAMDLSEVKDEMFAKRTLGDGIAIFPGNGDVCAPCDGEVIMIFETKHAIGIKTEQGAELLIHIGINTVAMEGKGFEVFVKVGDKVKAKDLLIRFDKEAMVAAQYDPTLMLIVSNGNEYKIQDPYYGDVSIGNALMKVKRGCSI
ncbi:MAG: beta-glucoside-specific PTS transporter subunit IIABC [Erysipelotrichaceae bacterium]|nr:beta-glucoside-specific PTS transporter subunit IIABC [Erysipelotrichaceae bacterium]